MKHPTSFPATDLIIIGGGAAGLMAATAAAEAGLRSLLIEAKHQPGRKLLMCANNRCNLTNALEPEALLAAYGAPVAAFLRPAVQAFTPRDLRAWFANNGLPTRVHKDGKVFPSTEKAADVLHAFTDALRRHVMPTLFNSPVQAVRRDADQFVVETAKLTVTSRFVLIATGGVSYPKTGSTGDGQNFAKALGHKLVPYQPGLVGFDVSEPWLAQLQNVDLPACTLRVMVKGQAKASTTGQVCFHCGCMRGPATVDMSRLIARQQWRNYWFVIDNCPGMPPAQVLAALESQQAAGLSLAQALQGRLLPRSLIAPFCRQVLQLGETTPLTKLTVAQHERLALAVKSLEVTPRKVRPLKEAMVTMGGVSLSEVDSSSMQSLRCAGLYFAGEVLDVDGPTGGFNLHAAFATARLAVRHIVDQALSGRQ